MDQIINQERNPTRCPQPIRPSYPKAIESKKKLRGSWIPDKGKDEFMVTGECIRKWIGISYLMVLYMGEHDTKELTNSKIFN